jgi:hypothetical protein
MVLIMEMKCTGDKMDRELRALINPQAILIGFAWKQAFASAVVTISGNLKFAPPQVEVLLLALSEAIVVVPAWRWFILPHVMKQEITKALQDAQKELEHEKGGAAMQALQEPLFSSGFGDQTTPLTHEEVIHAMKRLTQEGELREHPAHHDLDELIEEFEKVASRKHTEVKQIKDNPKVKNDVKAKSKVDKCKLCNRYKHPAIMSNGQQDGSSTTAQRPPAAAPSVDVESLRLPSDDLQKCAASLRIQLPELSADIAELRNLANLLNQTPSAREALWSDRSG